MLQSLSSLRRAAVVGAAVLGALGGAASAAEAAASVELRTLCTYPLFGTQEVSLKLEAGSLPSTDGVGPRAPAQRIFVSLNGGVTIATAMELARAVSATADSVLRTSYTGGGLPAPVEVDVAAPLTGWVDPETGEANLAGVGESPSLELPSIDPMAIAAEGFSMNMRWLKASGEAIRFQPVTQDPSGNPVSDSDGDPETFDVYCKINPPTQNRALYNSDKGCLPVIVPPQPPSRVGFSFGDIGTSSVHLRWGPPSQTGAGCPQQVESYRVSYGDQTVTLPGDQFDLEVKSLVPDRDYTFEVVAIGRAGDESEPLVSTAHTKPIVNETYGYSVQGAAAIRTLVRGAVPVAGSMSLTADPLVPGSLAGQTSLVTERAHLVALGFIPLDATLTFVPSGDTTATFDGTQLTTRSRFRIKLSDISIFGGAIPFAPIGDCQSRRPSALNLRSVGDFSLASGGQLQGTFAIGDLTGCAGLSGLLSLLTAGNGNALSVAVAPQAG